MRRLVKLSMVGLVLVDLPVLLVAAVFSARYGFRDTLMGVVEWRQDHPATYLVSAVLLLLLLWRLRRTAT